MLSIESRSEKNEEHEKILVTAINTFGPAPATIDTSLCITMILMIAALVLFAGWVDKNRAVKDIG